MKGGNAADAALTTAATLAVTEPCSTGETIIFFVMTFVRSSFLCLIS